METIQLGQLVDLAVQFFMLVHKQVQTLDPSTAFVTGAMTLTLIELAIRRFAHALRMMILVAILSASGIGFSHWLNLLANEPAQAGATLSENTGNAVGQ